MRTYLVLADARVRTVMNTLSKSYDDLVGLQWLLPDALYRAAGLAQTVQEPAVAQLRPMTPAWPVGDGPASRELDAWLRPLLPDGLVVCRGEDYGSPPETAATIRYRGARGGYVRVLRRRLTRPLLLDALCDPKREGSVTTRSSGTSVIRSNDNTDSRRLVIVRPHGTLLLIESIRLPAAVAPAPISSDQLNQLECTLDSPSSDLEIQPRSAEHRAMPRRGTASRSRPPDRAARPYRSEMS